MDDLTDSLVGLKIGEYELRQRIGVGGMGLVYDGIQPLIGKRVAVKVLRPELAAAEEQVARLLAEARAVNAIRHRGIVDIFGFGQVPDGRQYIIMEFLEGEPLDALPGEKGRLPRPRGARHPRRGARRARAPRTARASSTATSSRATSSW